MTRCDAANCWHAPPDWLVLPHSACRRQPGRQAHGDPGGHLDGLLYGSAPPSPFR